MNDQNLLSPIELKVNIKAGYNQHTSPSLNIQRLVSAFAGKYYLLCWNNCSFRDESAALAWLTIVYF
jgi:hypothetical protein